MAEAYLTQSGPHVYTQRKVAPPSVVPAAEAAALRGQASDLRTQAHALAVRAQAFRDKASLCDRLAAEFEAGIGS